MKKSYVCVLYWEKFCSCCLPTDYWTHFQLWDYNFNNYNFSAFSCPWTNFFFFPLQNAEQQRPRSKTGSHPDEVLYREGLVYYTVAMPRLTLHEFHKKVQGIKWFSVLCTEIFPASLNLLMMLCRAKIPKLLVAFLHCGIFFLHCSMQWVVFWFFFLTLLYLFKMFLLH